MSLAASARKAWRRPGGRSARRRAAPALALALLLLALAYAAGMLAFLLAGGGAPGPAVTVAVPSLRRRRRAADGPPLQQAQPGSVYRSHLVFERLWPAMRDDAALAASASLSASSASSRRSMVSGDRCSSLPVLLPF